MLKRKTGPFLQPTESISYLDLHFAALMLRLSNSRSPELFLAAALVSSQTRMGHICLDLTLLENDQFLREKLGDQVAELSIPSLDHMESCLQKASVVGRPGEAQPLLHDANQRLYLNRYWQYENHLAGSLKDRTVRKHDSHNLDQLRESLDKHFPTQPHAPIDWQQIAAATASLQNFCVITGGPGTGKTYTVARLLAVLQEVAQERDLRILLAAPTGKAAARLQDSIRRAKADLVCSQEILSAIPDEASTIHRLLGTIRHSPYFRHNDQNPLEVDVMIVDEASMVDLALMSKLALALPPHAKLILLGDNNQLASVEAGAVLADICNNGDIPGFSSEFAARIESVCGVTISDQAAETHRSPIQDCIVRLRHSYRFEKQKGIGALSAAVNAGDASNALDLLQDDQYPEIVWHDLDSVKTAQSTLRQFSQQNVFSQVETIFDELERLRTLCAVREGPQGANTINAQIERIVRRETGPPHYDRWYANQPVLVTQNDYSLKLYNGDLGVILPDPERDNTLMAHFLTSDGTIRKLRPFRLPEHETAYALTVHKSQGSEFEKVILLLPEQDTPILTRELIYTAITRATKSVEVWGNKNVFASAVARRITRNSGLRDALWGA